MALHIDAISNGLGAPSMMLMLLAQRKEIPATVSITADTGSELTRLCSDGVYRSNDQYVQEIVRPAFASNGMTIFFHQSA